MLNAHLRRLKYLLILILTLFALQSANAAPKNIILMIGDGMGPDQVWAAGAYLWGKEYHKFGGSKKLMLETLTNHYYVTTYPISGSYDPTWAGGNPEYPWKRSTDSAAAGTAMSCGSKTYFGAVGIGTVKITGANGKTVDVQKSLTSIQQYAQRAGMKTGVVTTMTICNATPATFIAHISSRGIFQAITHEALTETKPDVIMGAGNPDLAPNDIPGRPDLTQKLIKYQYIAKEDWDAVKEGRSDYTLTETRQDFIKLATTPAKGRVLGVFRDYSIIPPRNADGKGASPEIPTLAEMARGALATLDNPKGFFVMIEGGAIDERGHVSDLDGIIGETLGFDESVEVVLDWIAKHGGWEQNLLIITADHETGYLHGVIPVAPKELPVVIWGTDGVMAGHTNRLVDLYSQGTGAEAFTQYTKDIVDFERGKVKIINNTDIFKVMKAALQE